jgi:hypothetical protein
VIAGTTFPKALAPVEFSHEIDQDVFVSAGGTVHAWEQASADRVRIRFKLRHLSQSQASTLLDKYENVARASRNPITLRMDGDASDRTVHFMLGNRGLQFQKIRNDLYNVTLTFLQVAGTPGLVP